MFPLMNTDINCEPKPEILIISANDAVNFEYGNTAFKWTKKKHSHI